MKRYGLIGALICLIATGATAQERIIPGVSPMGFTGVKQLKGSPFFYTFYRANGQQDPKHTKYTFEALNDTLGSFAVGQIEGGRNMVLADLASGGGSTCLILDDAIKRTRTTVLLDVNGGLLKSAMEEDVRRELLMPEGRSSVFPAMNGGYLLVTPAAKNKRLGYAVRQVDMELKELWSKTYTPESGDYLIQDVIQEGPVIFVLRRETSGGVLSRDFMFSVQVISAESGETMATTALEDKNGNVGYPTFLTVGDGMLVTGGMYFKNGKMDDKNSDGLFFASMGLDGVLQKFNTTSWSVVSKQIKGDNSSALFGGKTKVLPQDMIRNGEGYTLIAETFRKSNDEEMTGKGLTRKLAGVADVSIDPAKGESGSVGFTLMDVVLFSFDGEGALTNVKRLERETKEAVVRGPMATQNGLAIAQWLYGQGFFGYKGVTMQPSGPYVIYEEQDGFKTRFVFAGLDANRVQDSIQPVDMQQWMPGAVNKIGKVTKSVLGNKQVFNSATNDDGIQDGIAFNGMLPMRRGGQVLIYNYTLPNLRMRTQRLMMAPPRLAPRPSKHSRQDDDKE